MIEKYKILVEYPPPPSEFDALFLISVTFPLYAIVNTVHFEVSHDLVHQMYEQI